MNAVADPKTIAWLLGGDAAIRWQTMRDLFDSAQAEIDAERSKVATEGWGRQLLDLQDPAGTWAKAIYSPKWISTTYTLLLLRRLGLPPGNEAAVRGTKCLWDDAIVRGGITFSRGTSVPDICVTAMYLALATYFEYEDDRRDGVVDWIIEQQLADGGWNCQSLRSGSSHGSYHTSISVLEALAELATNGGDDPALGEAAAKGREFFLDHRMYKSHRTGAVSHPTYTKLSFPPRWHYDVLRGLDYFRSVTAPWDERLGDALDLLVSKQRADGRWLVQHKHSGRVWFDMETGRQPSRWNTLRALRVVQWAALS